MINFILKLNNMKKVLLLLSILTISITGSSQSDLGINICGIKESEPNVTSLTIDQLFECGELTANNKNLTIVSFSLGFVVEGDFREVRIIGNKLSEKKKGVIKKYKPSKFYIEKIKLSSEKGTIQNGKVLTVKLVN